ncbi:LacI family DNA-binding transcriptional regulator [Paenibacillus allorhizosphaerae]|uniref:Ribose operon repressor n=1 Tax=Paenibacillus allorhizosphaerae TaxID=2849866 RepID=A0ABM8VCY8_9BACL|nr:LacI family DNA-binding transcriptional regulator [Paenibacillus allorhizosphaerae]CAG7625266.1 Ribose operon repressor [Paenibacillus allorhizosphaerae]
MSKLDEVAKLAGVSKSTVSRVINHSDTVSAQSKQKVLEAMQSLQFQAQELKRSSDNSGMIGVVLPFGKQIMSQSFGIDLLAGAEEKAFENDYMILIGNSVGGREQMLTAKMMQRGAEGLIMLIGGGRPGQKEHLKSIQAQGMPVVLVDQKVEGIDTHLVRGDNFMGAVTLMEHLFGLGHERIGIVSPNKHFTHKERIKGYRYALLDKSLRMPDRFELLVEGEGANVEEPLERMLVDADRPSALFVTSPGLLMGVMSVLNRLELRVPDHISIVTFDEVYGNFPEEHQDMFTAINQSGKQMGGMAVELLFQHSRNPEQEYQEIVLPGKFTIRRSTGPVQG